MRFRTILQAAPGGRTALSPLTTPTVPSRTQEPPHPAARGRESRPAASNTAEHRPRRAAGSEERSDHPLPPRAWHHPCRSAHAPSDGKHCAGAVPTTLAANHSVGRVHLTAWSTALPAGAPRCASALPRAWGAGKWRRGMAAAPGLREALEQRLRDLGIAATTTEHPEVGPRGEAPAMLPGAVGGCAQGCGWALGCVRRGAASPRHGLGSLPTHPLHVQSDWGRQREQYVAFYWCSFKISS